MITYKSQSGIASQALVMILAVVLAVGIGIVYWVQQDVFSGCSLGSIRYKSTPSYMGPNGLVFLPPQGDGLCHRSCETDAQCKKDEYCAEKNLADGDLGGPVKFCLKQSSPGSDIICTKEGKVCPDASIVGRVGPNCEFAPCPANPPAGGEGGGSLKPSQSQVDTSTWKTYRNQAYGFQISYPGDLKLLEQGPNSYELQLREGKQISGTQAPLLDTFEFKNVNNKTVFLINIADQKKFPVVSGEYDWQLRTCGEEGFATIQSQAKTTIFGYKVLHVTSLSENQGQLQQNNFYCINFPLNPIILHFNGMDYKMAEAIASTFNLYNTF